MITVQSNPISRESFNYFHESLYGTYGVYEQMQDFVGANGEAAASGRLTVISGKLPTGGDREYIHVDAKLAGGVRVARCLMSLSGHRLVDRYFVMLPSEPSFPSLCSYGSVDARRQPHATALHPDNLLGRIGLSESVEYAQTLNRSLDDLAQVFAGAAALPDARLDTERLLN